MLRLGSLFSGSGGFELAGCLQGMIPIWCSEIEPYPIAVTKSRFPNIKHLGDVSKIDGGQLEPVDVITFGSPCQNLSIAGNQKGLQGEQSKLFHEAIRIIKEMREATNGSYPRFAVWENVPGAFSSNKGEDFRTVLQEFVNICEPSAVVPKVPKAGWSYYDCWHGDGWSIAYRTFDAQFWGVPQRRRRIYLVADFASECAKEILFEQDSLRGYFEKGRTPWEEIATNVARCFAPNDKNGRSDKCFGIDQYNGDLTGDKSSTLGVNCGMSTGRNAVITCTEDKVIGVDCYNLCTTGNIGRTLATSSGGLNEHIPVIITNEKPITFEPGILKREGGHIYEGVSGTLRANAGDNQLAVAYCENGVCGYDGYNQCLTGDVSKTITSGRNDTHNIPCVIQQDVCGVDFYNQAITGDKAKSITSAACDSDHIPCVVVETDSKTIYFDKYNQNTIVELSATLKCPNGGDSYPIVCMATQQGGAEIREDNIAPCLTASAGMSGNNQPVICFHLLQDPISSENVTPCVSCGNSANGQAMIGIAYAMVENHPADSRVNIDESGTCQCLTSRMGTGGGNVPMVLCIDMGGGKSNCVVDKNLSPTLTCTHYGEPAIAYCVGNGQVDQSYLQPKVGALNCMHEQQYVIALDRASFNQGQNVAYEPQFYEDGTNPTLVAKGPSAIAFQTYQKTTGCLMANHHPGGITGQDADNDMLVVEPTDTELCYIVRRLTPTECARLQGFPDNWGHPVNKESFTDEEFDFWLNVRKTHAIINGKKTMNWKKEAMVKWYNSLHTDSAEYKMWGNGVALPTTMYVMQGIADICRKVSDSK